MQSTIGFIGCGNMARAMISGILKNKAIAATQLLISDPSADARERAKVDFNADAVLDNKVVAKMSDYLFLSVKPQHLYRVIREIREVITPDTVVISIVAGQSMKDISEAFNQKVKLVRAMPNTPALVGAGMTALAVNGNLSDEELHFVHALFSCCGRACLLDESLMDAVTAVSGSTPAFVFMFIEALADGAVAEGMPRNLSQSFAAQAVLGAAKMVLETGRHPGALKDMVCSPAGTTIAGVRKLEEAGFRGSVMNAVIAASEVSKEK